MFDFLNVLATARVDVFSFVQITFPDDCPAATSTSCARGGGAPSCPILSSMFRRWCSPAKANVVICAVKTQAGHSSRLAVAALGCGAILHLAAPI